MDFYVVPQQSLVVGWSRKCACTSVCDWLVNGVIKPEAGTLEGKTPRAYLAENRYFWPAKEALAKIALENYTPVLFTRNPLSRIESAYLSKFVYRNGRALANESQLEPFARNLIEDLYQTSGYTGEYKGLSLVELLEYIKSRLSEKKYLDGHWAPQVLTGDQANLNIRDELVELVKSGRRYLVKQESFDHDLTNVNYALGLSYLPARANRTSAPKNWQGPKRDADFSRMPSAEIIRARIALPRRTLLTPEVKALVRDIYRDDFNLFSYPLA